MPLKELIVKLQKMAEIMCLEGNNEQGRYHVTYSVVFN